MMAEDDETSLDAFFGGRVRILQPRRGARSGLDAVLLAAAAPATTGEIVDVGSGAGVVGLGAALRAPAARLTLVEIEPGMAGLARANLQSNGLAGRGRVVECDVSTPRARRAAGLLDGAAAVVLTNPPYYAAGRVRPPADAARALAHVMPAAGSGEAALAAWLRACLALLAPGGEFRMVHRADALGPALAAIGGRLGSLRVLPVHPRADAPATRILLAGRKGARGPLALAPGLVLHDADGAPTARLSRLSAGAEALFPDESSPLRRLNPD
jgi:tRNA1(Val) A37 N6-methylase TrmN6